MCERDGVVHARRVTYDGYPSGLGNKLLALIAREKADWKRVLEVVFDAAPLGWSSFLTRRQVHADKAWGSVAMGENWGDIAYVYWLDDEDDELRVYVGGPPDFRHPNERVAIGADGTPQNHPEWYEPDALFVPPPTDRRIEQVPKWEVLDDAIRSAAAGFIDLALVERVVRWSLRDRLAAERGEDLSTNWWFDAEADASWVVGKLGATTVHVPDRPTLGSIRSFWMTNEHGATRGLPIVPSRKTAEALQLDRVEFRMAFDVPIVHAMGLGGVQRAVRWTHPWGHEAIAYETSGSSEPDPNPKWGDVKLDEQLGLGWIWWWSGLR